MSAALQRSRRRARRPNELRSSTSRRAISSTRQPLKTSPSDPPGALRRVRSTLSTRNWRAGPCFPPAEGGNILQRRRQNRNYRTSGNTRTRAKTALLPPTPPDVELTDDDRLLQFAQALIVRARDPQRST